MNFMVCFRFKILSVFFESDLKQFNFDDSASRNLISTARSSHREAPCGASGLHIHSICLERAKNKKEVSSLEVTACQKRVTARTLPNSTESVRVPCLRRLKRTLTANGPVRAQLQGFAYWLNGGCTTI